nr:MAG TPA: vesicle-associated membrane protein 2 [Caudoviricetes sp.]
MDNLERNLIETAERAKSNTHRIDELEQTQKTIQELALSVKEIALNTQAMQKELVAQGAKIEALEKIPAQRWNSLMKTLVTSIATTLLGGIVGAVLALVLHSRV